MKLSEVLASWGCVLLVLSCSIKEERDVCPCRLMLDMVDVDTSVVRYAELVVTTSGRSLKRDTLEVSDIVNGYTVDVPRGEVGIGVYFEAGGCVDDVGHLGIEYGDECPQVYMHSSLIKAEGEMVREHVLIKKNHCIMTIQVETEKDFPFKLEARGHIDGYGLGGIPSVGEFLYAMYTDESGRCQISLPRQIDASLVLEVHDDSGVLKSFALGEYVAASGYDWTEDDLRDITISLDYSLTRVQISVAGWREVFVFDVVV